ncbi:uncharacterized protein METZ01_LOCUS20163 [marine metagenome]|uniref:Uncharacterized protein n=1 Tax=marine metagenome TaxID=408172 RepID=A0A381PMM4_9ZZZZ
MIDDSQSTCSKPTNSELLTTSSFVQLANPEN